MKFHEVRIVMFDVNTSIAPIASPGCMRSPFGFFSDRETYNPWYAARAGVTGGSLRVRPIPAKVFDENHFWQNYRGSTPDPLHPDYWGLLIPALVSLPSLKLGISSGDPSFTATIRPVVFLSPVGWSTNLCLTLSGDITPEGLTGFVRDLRAGGRMSIDGAPANASGIFKTISSRIATAIFEPACNRVHTVTVPSYAVIAVTAYSGTGVITGGGEKPLTDAGRGMLYGVLRGEECSTEEWANAQGSYLAREVGTRGTCAITDFQKGTIIFMPTDALRNDPALHDSRKLQCVTANVARAMMITLMGAKFNDRAIQSSDPRVVELGKSVRKSLSGITSAYTNPIFTTWAPKHASIGRAREGGPA